MIRSFLPCLLVVGSLAFAGGCHSVTEATQSKAEYSKALDQIQTDAGAALKEFSQKMGASVGVKEGEKLRTEATDAFKKDMETAKSQLRALQPPLQAMGDHLKALGILEGAERLALEVSKNTKTFTAESLRVLSKEMDKAAGELGRLAEQVPKQ